MQPEYEPAISLKREFMRWLGWLLEREEPLHETSQFREVPALNRDLLPTIEAFREQRHLLARFHLDWPAALGFISPERNRVQTVPIPLDLRPSETAGLPLAHDPQWLSWQINERAEVVSRSGLQVQTFSTRQLADSFIDLVSDVLVRRSVANVDLNRGPPTDMFTVTTDSPGLEVLFAQGVFLSTGEGFGISTPARRSLPWGYYMFGASIGGLPDFSSAAVWKVPDVTSVHLKI